MRVIAGSAKGIILNSLAGRSTRPMLDRTKEAIFSALGFDNIVQTNVWDMYAGSASLGIEALSRGAKFALFTDSSNSAVQIIKTNLAKTHFLENSKVMIMDCNKMLNREGLDYEPFDLIFCDPPFSMDQPNISKIFDSKLLSKDALVVYQREKSRGELEILETDSFETEWQRTYGSSIIYFFRRK